MRGRALHTQMLTLPELGGEHPVALEVDRAVVTALREALAERTPR